VPDEVAEGNELTRLAEDAVPEAGALVEHVRCCRDGAHLASAISSEIAGASRVRATSPA
jgi:hypothetical protein